MPYCPNGLLFFPRHVPCHGARRLVQSHVRPRSDGRFPGGGPSTWCIRQHLSAQYSQCPVLFTPSAQPHGIRLSSGSTRQCKRAHISLRQAVLMPKMSPPWKSAGTPLMRFHCCFSFQNNIVPCALWSARSLWRGQGSDGSRPCSKCSVRRHAIQADFRRHQICCL